MIPETGTVMEIKHAVFGALSEPLVGEVYLWLPDSFETECWLVVAVPKNKQSQIMVNALERFNGKAYDRKRRNWSAIDYGDWLLFANGNHLRCIGFKPLK